MTVRPIGSHSSIKFPESSIRQTKIQADQTPDFKNLSNSDVTMLVSYAGSFKISPSTDIALKIKELLFKAELFGPSDYNLLNKDQKHFLSGLGINHATLLNVYKLGIGQTTGNDRIHLIEINGERAELIRVDDHTMRALFFRSYQDPTDPNGPRQQMIVEGEFSSPDELLDKMKSSPHYEAIEGHTLSNEFTASEGAELASQTIEKKWFYPGWKLFWLFNTGLWEELSGYSEIAQDN